MAAIAGIVHADRHRAVAPDMIEAMRRGMRLPVRPSVQPNPTDGALLLGADVYEDSASGLSVVFDGRLDDRADLARGFGSAAGSDAELVAHAFLRRGTGCVALLTGDFAFAIWDKAARRLFCARDQLGVVPYFYRADDADIRFASRLAAIARPDDALHMARISAFLEGIEDDATDTVFSGIRRLPPGHWLLWSPGRLRIERYWTPATDELHDGEDYVAGFKSRFVEAVADRSAGVDGLGAMLSGGLDSSSIVSVAAGGRATLLRTYSFGYSSASPFDEAEYVRAVAERYPLQARTVGMEGLAPLDGLADIADGMDDLIFAPGLPKIVRLLHEARADGVRIVLDGHGGDEIVSQGFGRLGELARDRRWRTLFREARGIGAISGESAIRLFLGYYLRQGMSGRLRRLAPGAAPPPAAPSIVHRDLRRAGDLDARGSAWQQSYRQATRSERALHLWNVSSPAVARAFETLRQGADHARVDLRFPFYDRRLVTYALAMPDDERLKDGWPRSVLRRAMAGILPEKVQWRQRKVDFGPELAAGLAHHHASLLADLLAPASPVAGYVDLDVARLHLHTLLAQPGALNPGDLFALWRVAFLGLWLNSRSATARRERVLS